MTNHPDLLYAVRAGTACPVCAVREEDATHCRVYRSSDRSVTMQCQRCGLQWTMTWHMFGRAADYWATHLTDDPADHRSDHFAAAGKRFYLRLLRLITEASPRSLGNS